MKKLLFTFSLILAVTYQAKAQVTIEKNLSNKGGGAGGKSTVRNEIPNYTLSKETHGINSRSPKDGFVIKNDNGRGVGKKTSHQKNFIERKDKKGFPIGWITNSELPVLDSGSDINYLKLGEKQHGVYLGYLFDHIENTTEFLLSFKNNSEVNFIIIEINNSGTKSPPIIFELPVGNHIDYRINLEPTPNLKSLLIKFLKKKEGEFKLIEFKIMEG